MQSTEAHKTNGVVKMNDTEVMDTLENVSQEYTGELTSLTQYSVIYHNSEKSMELCVYPDYSEMYYFELN